MRFYSVFFVIIGIVSHKSYWVNGGTIDSPSLQALWCGDCSLESFSIESYIAAPLKLFEGPRVYVTVNAEAAVDPINDQFLNRMIEVNWYNVQITDGNWIGVYTQDPGEGKKPVARISPTTVEGSVKTRLRFAVMDYREVTVRQDGCVGYWVAYYVTGVDTPTTFNCLKVYPDWMFDLKETIGSKRLDQLMIPGTHNAGSWKVYEGQVDDDNLAMKYSLNQEDSIFAQLVHGVRYFDLRISHYPETPEKFWINHGDFRIQPLAPLLDDFKEFCADHREIIVIDIHALPVGFTGPQDPAHLDLIELLRNQLQTLLYRESSGLKPTLDQMWATAKTVILTYPERSVESAEDFLWPSVYHDWANVNKVSELEEHFGTSLPSLGCTGTLFAAMAELTPTAADIFLQPEFGLRGFAQMVNGPVTEWFRRDDWYQLANIVATDYYLGNNVVQIAIEVNLNSGTWPRRS